MDWNAWTGWGGALLVLAAFFFTVVRNWKPESGRYMVLSNVAAVLLVVNAWMNAAYPFLVVNAALILVTLYTLVKNGIPSWR
jgi:hydrogenase-4 membrane subunit HyfE